MKTYYGQSLRVANTFVINNPKYTLIMHTNCSNNSKRFHMIIIDNPRQLLQKNNNETKQESENTEVKVHWHTANPSTSSPVLNL